MIEKQTNDRNNKFQWSQYKRLSQTIKQHIQYEIGNEISKSYDYTLSAEFMILQQMEMVIDIKCWVILYKVGDCLHCIVF